MMKETKDGQLESTSSIIPKSVILIEVDENSAVVELNTNAALCSYRVAEIGDDGKAKILDESTVALQLAGNEYPQTDGKAVLVVEEITAAKSKITVSRISRSSSRLLLFVCQWPVDIGVMNAIKELRDLCSGQQKALMQAAREMVKEVVNDLRSEIDAKFRKIEDGISNLSTVTIPERIQDEIAKTKAEITSLTEGKVKEAMMEVERKDNHLRELISQGVKEAAGKIMIEGAPWGWLDYVDVQVGRKCVVLKGHSLQGGERKEFAVAAL